MFRWIKKLLEVLIGLSKYMFISIWCDILKINNGDVWLISERGVDARDNAYHFYRYLKKNHPEIKSYYVITKSSSDYKNIDPDDVVKYGSKRHYVLFKTAGVLISTHIMGFSPNMSLFWRLDKRGLLNVKGKRIFLQHGILTNSYDGYWTKLDLFITSSRLESNSVNENVGDKDIIRCTGLARYDCLVDKSKDNKQLIILIMPTFRKWLNFSSHFSESLYCKRWNELLNNDEFINYVKKKNARVFFYPHYEFQKYLKYFKSKLKSITICSINDYDVQDLLVRSNVLITDYSSVQFDFAYMGKPVIYYQFDEKEFYGCHYKKGYFDFRSMGFGPVCVDIDSVIHSMTCPLDDYSLRVKKFFMHHDCDNCSRIFGEICNVVLKDKE